MSNIIKYSETSATNSIQSGNFNVGVNNTSTNLTGFFNGISPIVGGYTIYVNKVSGGPSIYSPKNDSELISIANRLGANVETAANALVWINSQSNMTVLNNNYPSIVTSGMVLNLDAGFVSSYPKTGTTWRDLSGNGYNGTLVNGPTYSTDGGGSISFDGTDDYVSLPINSSFNTSSITFEVWANLSSTPSRQILMVNWQGNSLEVNANRSVVMYNYSSGGQLGAATSASIFNWGSWTHFLGVYDNSSQSLKTYINGVLQATSTGVPSTIYSVGVHKIAGTDYSLGIFGNVASARHYNRALSAAEVLQNYYAGLQRLIPTDGLVLSLDTQNTNLYAVSTTTAYDISGNNINGTLTNGVQYVSDGDGSWKFDGVDDYINLGNVINYTTGDYSVSMWVKIPSSSSAFTTLFSKKGVAAANSGYAMYYNGSNRKLLWSNGDSSNIQEYYTVSEIPLDQWINVVCIRNVSASSKGYFYINGVKYGITNNPTGLNVSNNYNLTIGKNSTGGYLFIGNIGGISIYNRALTETEITTIYNAAKSRYGL